MRLAAQELGEDTAIEALRAIRPSLYREGRSFPKSEAELNRLFGRRAGVRPEPRRRRGHADAAPRARPFVASDPQVAAVPALVFLAPALFAVALSLALVARTSVPSSARGDREVEVTGPAFSIGGER